MRAIPFMKAHHGPIGNQESGLTAVMRISLNITEIILCTYGDGAGWNAMQRQLVRRRVERRIVAVGQGPDGHVIRAVFQDKRYAGVEGAGPVWGEYL